MGKSANAKPIHRYLESAVEISLEWSVRCRVFQKRKMNTVVEGAIRPSSVVEETAVADEKLERSDYYEVAGEMVDP